MPITPTPGYLGAVAQAARQRADAQQAARRLRLVGDEEEEASQPAPIEPPRPRPFFGPPPDASGEPFAIGSAAPSTRTLVYTQADREADQRRPFTPMPDDGAPTIEPAAATDRARPRPFFDVPPDAAGEPFPLPSAAPDARPARGLLEPVSPSARRLAPVGPRLEGAIEAGHQPYEEATVRTPMGGMMTVPYQQEQATSRPAPVPMRYGPTDAPRQLAAMDERAGEGFEAIDPSEGGKRPDTRGWGKRLLGGLGAAGLELASGGGIGGAIVSGIGGAQRSEYGSKMGRFGDYLRDRRLDYDQAREDVQEQRKLKRIEDEARIRGIDAQTARDWAYAERDPQRKASWTVKVIKEGDQHMLVRINPETGENEPVLDELGAPRMWDAVKPRGAQDRIVKLRNEDQSESVYLLGEDGATLYPVAMPGGGQATSAAEAQYETVNAPGMSAAQVDEQVRSELGDGEKLIKNPAITEDPEGAVMKARTLYNGKRHPEDPAWEQLTEVQMNPWFEDAFKGQGGVWIKRRDTPDWNNRRTQIQADADRQKTAGSGGKRRINPVAPSAAAASKYEQIRRDFDAGRIDEAEMRRQVNALNAEIRAGGQAAVGGAPPAAPPGAVAPARAPAAPARAPAPGEKADVRVADPLRPAPGLEWMSNRKRNPYLPVE